MAEYRELDAFLLAMRKEAENINQKIQAYERSICPKCIHWGVCRAAENQPCVECSCYLPAADVVERPRWIPVEEKKPPLPDGEDLCYVNVIAAIKGRKESELVRYCRASRFRGDGKWERIERFVGDGEVVKVTHWMPLQEPPAE